MFSQIVLAMTLSLHKLRPSSADRSEFGRKLNILAFFTALCMTQMTVKLFVRHRTCTIVITNIIWLVIKIASLYEVAYYKVITLLITIFTYVMDVPTAYKV